MFPRTEHRRKTFGSESSDGNTSSTSSFGSVDELSDPSYFELRTDSGRNAPPASQPEPRTDYSFKAFFENFQYLERAGQVGGEVTAKEGPQPQATETCADSSTGKGSKLADISAILALGEESNTSRSVKKDECSGNNDDKVVGRSKKGAKKLKRKELTEEPPSKKSTSKNKPRETASTKGKRHSGDSDWEEVSGKCFILSCHFFIAIYK